MKRAGIFIGVDKSGGLPKLADAAAGARRIASEWANAQGLDPLVVITDDVAPVTAYAITQEVCRLVTPGDLDQLVIYFAGHGVNLCLNEYWLLTGAPVMTQEAVNVTGSVELARYCGVPHVIFISDSCRSAAEGIQAQFVTGSVIFPNQGAMGKEMSVDQFFACTLGRPALEVRDPKDSARAFKALYTSAFIAAASGQVSRIRETCKDGDKEADFIRPWPLKRELSSLVADRIRESGLRAAVNQTPDARITSPPEAWVSKLEPETPHGSSSSGLLLSTSSIDFSLPGDTKAAGRVPGLPEPMDDLVRSILQGDAGALKSALTRGPRPTSDRLDHLRASAERYRLPFGPTHHETRCGFKIRGTRFADVVTPGFYAQIVNPDARDDIRVDVGSISARSALLIFEDGQAALLPALPGFLCGLTFEDGELVEVAYEPSEHTARWDSFIARSEQVRLLRAAAAAATGNGVFYLEGEDGFRVARNLQMMKDLDPALSIYSTYAYNELRRVDLIREMGRFQIQDLQGRFFDLAMLARDMDGKVAGQDAGVISSVPLLAQGWAYLSAFKISLPDGLQGIEDHLTPSVWTLFHPSGVAKLRAAITSGAFL